MLKPMKSWTSLERFTAIEMSRAGASDKMIGEKLGRSRKAVGEWFKRQRENGYEYRLRSTNREPVVDFVAIPPFVAADLDRRMSIAPTLDHVLTGTPLPTCSALDRPEGLYYAR